MASLELVLPRSFYVQDSVTVARELVGKLLVRRLEGVDLIGRIVEVEAYGGENDPASHAFRGVTDRNRLMFGVGGFAYVYFTYGKHWCFNVTTGPEGVAGAVLARALEPLRGIEVMQKNRGVKRLRDLTNGPGKLTEALGIRGELNGVDLTKEGELFICKSEEKGNFEVVVGKRVGIRFGLQKPWRFYIKDNKFVSRT